MKKASVIAIIGICALALLASGCNQELENAKTQNRLQAERLAKVSRQLRDAHLDLSQCQKQLANRQTAHIIPPQQGRVAEWQTLGT